MMKLRIRLVKVERLFSLLYNMRNIMNFHIKKHCCYSSILLSSFFRFVQHYSVHKKKNLDPIRGILKILQEEARIFHLRDFSRSAHPRCCLDLLCCTFPTNRREREYKLQNFHNSLLCLLSISSSTFNTSTPCRCRDYASRARTLIVALIHPLISTRKSNHRIMSASSSSPSEAGSGIARVSHHILSLQESTWASSVGCSRQQTRLVSEIKIVIRHLMWLMMIMRVPFFESLNVCAISCGCF